MFTHLDLDPTVIVHLGRRGRGFFSRLCVDSAYTTGRRVVMGSCGTPSLEVARFTFGLRASLSLIRSRHRKGLSCGDTRGGVSGVGFDYRINPGRAVISGGAQSLSEERPQTRSPSHPEPVGSSLKAPQASPLSDHPCTSGHNPSDTSVHTS